MVRERVENQALALPALGSADWANGPAAGMQLLNWFLKVKIKVKLAFSSPQDRILRATVCFVREWGSGSSPKFFFHITRVIKHSSVLIFALLGWWRSRLNHKNLNCSARRVQSKCNTICEGRLDTCSLSSFYEQINRDLQIGLRVRDWVRVRFSNFKPVTFQEPLFFMLVVGRESSSWDEMGMCCDNVKPEN